MRGNAFHQRYPKEYSAWKNMKSRAKKRGDFVSPEFQTFEGFFRHVGLIPGEGYSIDRIDNKNHGYSPGNVRWATKVEQANNRRNTITVTYNGKPHPIAEVARLSGQNPDTLRRRLSRGYSDEEVVNGRNRVDPSPGAVEDEQIDRLADLRWLGDDEQIANWRKYYLWRDETPGGTVALVDDQTSFAEFVWMTAQGLLTAFAYDDFSRLHHALQRFRRASGAERETLIARLTSVTGLAFAEVIRERYAGDPLVNIRARACEVPWVHWDAQGNADKRRVVELKRVFDKSGASLPPRLAELWNAYKSQFMRR